MKERTSRSQSGQAIVIVGAMLIALTILGTMVFDVGLSMSDRRNLQAYADAAALAGARSYGPAGPAPAHWVALQYLAPTLGFTLPTGACAGPANCPAGTYSVAGFNIQLLDSFRVNGIYNYPSVLDVLLQHQQPSIFARMVGFSLLKTAASARASTPGPEFVGAVYAVAAVTGDANINGGGAAFQTVGGPVYAYGSFGANNGPHSTGVPSVQYNYNGTAPCSPAIPNQLDNGGGPNGLNYNTTDGGTLATRTGIPWNDVFSNASPTTAGPVYLSAASPSLALGNVTNTVHATSGTSNGADAVAIVIDSSDTGGLNLSQAVLNGLDDINNTGLRDPAGTHNFVIYGGSGPTAYTAGVTIGPGASTDMSGIIYLPKSPYVSDGNSSPQFTGSLIVASMTVQGGGNGAQVFHWVCGLNAVNDQRYSGGLLR